MAYCCQLLNTGVGAQAAAALPLDIDTSLYRVVYTLVVVVPFSSCHTLPLSLPFFRFY